MRKRGQRFWQRGCLSTISGNITDDIVMPYLDRHTHKNGLSPSAWTLPASDGLSFRAVKHQ